jgi:hypothetical protein
MSQIHNLEGISVEQLNRELRNGAKFVVFPYCISVIFITFRRSSDIYFLRQGESSTRHSIRYTLLTFSLGWWGFPWGLVYSVDSLYHNLRGGKDETQEVLAALNAQAEQHPA